MGCPRFGMKLEERRDRRRSGSGAEAKNATREPSLETEECTLPSRGPPRSSRSHHASPEVSPGPRPSPSGVPEAPQGRPVSPRSAMGTSLTSASAPRWALSSRPPQTSDYAPLNTLPNTLGNLRFPRQLLLSKIPSGQSAKTRDAGRPRGLRGVVV